MSDFANRLRSELLPASQLEELFFDTIARLSTCASYLSQHIERDPDFSQPETPRRMRLLLSTESKLRYAYEEFRRLKMARQLQIEDEILATRPLLAVVATYTSRSGFRRPPPSQNRDRKGAESIRQIQQLQLNDAAEDARLAAARLTEARIAPGRNAVCPCNSGRKYKHCCANKQAAA